MAKSVRAARISLIKQILKAIIRRDGIFIPEEELTRCAIQLVPYLSLSNMQWDITLDPTNTRIVHCTLRSISSHDRKNWSHLIGVL